MDKKQEKGLKGILIDYYKMRDFGNSSPWRHPEKIMFHKLYLIGILDKPFLTKEEEYNYYDMGTPYLEGLIESRLLNKRYKCIDDDYLEN